MDEREERMTPVGGTESGSMGARRNRRAARPCGLCASHADRLMRIKGPEDGPWFVPCPICAARVSEDNPYFAYGGRIARRPARASA